MTTALAEGSHLQMKEQQKHIPPVVLNHSLPVAYDTIDSTHPWFEPGDEVLTDQACAKLSMSGQVLHGRMESEEIKEYYDTETDEYVRSHRGDVMMCVPAQVTLHTRTVGQYDFTVVCIRKPKDPRCAVSVKVSQETNAQVGAYREVLW